MPGLNYENFTRQYETVGVLVAGEGEALKNLFYLDPDLDCRQAALKFEKRRLHSDPS